MIEAHELHATLPTGLDHGVGHPLLLLEGVSHVLGLSEGLSKLIAIDNSKSTPCALKAFIDRRL
jgi:hypothetical protein